MAAQDITLTEDIGQVKLGDTILPGSYQRMGVHRALRMPSSSVSGRSGATMQPQGWEPAEVSLELLLCEEDGLTVRQQMETIAGLMTAADATGRPRLYAITHWLLAAYKIRQVAFVDVEGGDDNESDAATATLKFVEVAPATRKVEARRPVTKASQPTPVGDGQTATDWLGEGITLAAESEPTRSFFFDPDQVAGQSVAAADDEGRPSSDEDQP